MKLSVINDGKNRLHPVENKIWYEVYDKDERAISNFLDKSITVGEVFDTYKEAEECISSKECAKYYGINKWKSWKDGMNKLLHCDIKENIFEGIKG